MSLAKSNAFRGGIWFLLVAGMVLGGLGWATRESLRLEREQAIAAADADKQEAYRQELEAWNAKLRLALWRLDARMGPPLAREDSRPYSHYVEMFSPFPIIDRALNVADRNFFFVPSPLLTSEMPDWIQFHFQIDPTRGWSSPEVIPLELQTFLKKPGLELKIRNMSPERRSLFFALQKCYPAGALLPLLQARGVLLDDSQTSTNNNNPNYYSLNNRSADNNNASRLDTNEKNASAANTPQQATQPSNSLDFQMRRSTSRAENNDVRNPENRNGAWSLNTLALNRPTSELIVGSMAPVWLPSHEKPEQLLFVRAGMSGVVPIYQGFILDWPKLRELLRKEIGDLFENVEFHPLPEKEPLHPEKAMSTLPIELEVLDAAPMQPEPIQSVNIATWTPLRLGLLVAWLSSLIALSAVGLVGWSLMALSERRIRFVSAVTHELRTPLTTIRLYLDMLQQGMVTEEKQRNEYLGTLNGEADRLNRLIGNVLDYARLEKQSIPIRTQAIVLRTFLDSIKNLWQERCREASKELIIESEFPSDFDFCSDQPLLERILSNLIDNARKYSSPASEPGIWLRATRRGNRLRFEVEDKGPGVARKDRRSIFRAFRRGGQADFQAGGVGLGLALAANWARMIGGRLRYAPKATGACFTLEIAITK